MSGRDPSRGTSPVTGAVSAFRNSHTILACPRAVVSGAENCQYRYVRAPVKTTAHSVHGSSLRLQNTPCFHDNLQTHRNHTDVVVCWRNSRRQCVLGLANSWAAVLPMTPRVQLFDSNDVSPPSHLRTRTLGSVDPEVQQQAGLH